MMDFEVCRTLIRILIYPTVYLFSQLEEFSLINKFERSCC